MTVALFCLKGMASGVTQIARETRLSLHSSQRRTSFQEVWAAVYTEIAPAVRETKKWGFINESGQMVIAPEYEAVGYFSEGLAAVSRQWPWSDTDTWGYINKQGEMVIKPQFNKAFPFSEGLALVEAGGVRFTDPIVKDFVKMGYIDKGGRWVIASKYWYFFYENFSEGAVPFRKNFGKWGYMNQRGKVFIRPQFDWTGIFSMDWPRPDFRQLHARR